MPGDSHGTVRVRAFAERLASALGDGWVVETRQAAAPGTVAQAAVHRTDGPLRILLEDLGVFVSLTVLPYTAGGHWQPSSIMDLDGKIPAIAAAVATASAAGEEARTNVADAAWRIAAALETMIPIQGGAWDFSITSVAYPPVYGSVNLIGGDSWDGIVTAAPRSDGVLIEVPGTSVSLPASHPADVRAHLIAIAHGVVARFEQRRTHHQLTVRIKGVAEAIVAALEDRVKPPHGHWTVELQHDFPSPPAAHILARGGDDYIEGFATIDQAGPGDQHDVAHLRVQTRDGGDRRDATIERRLDTDEDLAAAVEAIVPAIRWWATRLSVPRLQLHRRYRVLRPFARLAVGDELVFAAREHIPKEGWTRYTFTAPGGEVYLDEGYEPDLAVLRDLDLYVE